MIDILNHLITYFQEKKFWLAVSLLSLTLIVIPTSIALEASNTTPNDSLTLIDSYEVNSLIEYKGKLYAFVYAGNKSGVWAYNPKFHSWDQVKITGWPADMWTSTVWKDKLFLAGLGHVNGKPRKTVLSFDGDKWRLTFLPELPDQPFNEVFSLAGFKGYLYAGDGNGRLYRSLDGFEWQLIHEFPREHPVPIQYGRAPIINVLVDTTGEPLGPYLWALMDCRDGNTSWAYRSLDGMDWEKVSDLPFPVRGNTERSVYGDRIFVGSCTGQVWSSEDGVSWRLETYVGPPKEQLAEKVSPADLQRIDVRVKGAGGLLFAFGGRPLDAGWGSLWVYDGRWIKLLERNEGISDIEILEGSLFVGTSWNKDHTTSIFKIESGIFWDDIRIGVVDVLGLPISGARVDITLPNRTTIVTQTDENGTVLIHNILKGDFNVTVVYLGQSDTLKGRVRDHVVVTFMLSPAIIVLIICTGLVLSVIVIKSKIKRNHTEID